MISSASTNQTPEISAKRHFSKSQPAMALRIRSHIEGIKRLNNILPIGVYECCRCGACGRLCFSNHKRDKDQGVYNIYLKF